MPKAELPPTPTGVVSIHTHFNKEENMPGHDIMHGLSIDQKGTKFDGKFLLVKEGIPTDGTSGDTGYGRCAFGINLNGSQSAGSSDCLYVNTGTKASPVWKPFYMN